MRGSRIRSVKRMTTAQVPDIGLAHHRAEQGKLGHVGEHAAKVLGRVPGTLSCVVGGTGTRTRAGSSRGEETLGRHVGDRVRHLQQHRSPLAHLTKHGGVGAPILAPFGGRVEPPVFATLDGGDGDVAQGERRTLWPTLAEEDADTFGDGAAWSC